MTRFFTTALCAALMCGTVSFADEFEDVVQGALDAYQEGNVKIAKEEIEYALELLQNAETKTLQGIVPQPLDGWTMEFTDNATSLTMMGGVGVSADYNNKNTGDRFSLTLASSSQLVGLYGAMFGNTAAMGALGELIRIEREKFVISEGQIQGFVNNKFHVNFVGENEDAMRAHLEIMDIKALKEF